MIYMKVGESVKFVTFESLPKNVREYYVNMYYHSNVTSRFYDTFIYAFAKHVKKHHVVFEVSIADETINDFSKKYGWYFLLTEDDRVCVPVNTNFKGDPDGILAKYKYDFDENSVTVTRIK